MPVIPQISDQHLGSHWEGRVCADQFIRSHGTGSGPPLAEGPRIILIIILGIPRKG
jgi:hypothetical protein